MDKGLVKIKRALISVSDKTGIYELAKALLEMDIELISTGGTSKYLKERGLNVTDVSEVTNFPELMDGRLKTLHPKIHGGLLANRDNKNHCSSMKKHKIPEIDLLVVNLYPFEDAVQSEYNLSEIIENIDIGGPAMIRAGAKNYKYVSVLVDLVDYSSFLKELMDNCSCTSLCFRRDMAEIAFARTAEYDGLISQWMLKLSSNKSPRRFTTTGRLKRSLRYGENPHQSASYYQTDQNRDSLTNASILQGKDLSFNNINDFNSAIEVLREFDNEPGALAVIIKHANTCGVALRDDPLLAYLAAFDCDQTAAFGGVIAFNVNIDKKTAQAITQVFVEIVIAPSADEDAIFEFSKKKDLRLIIIKKSQLLQKNELKFKQTSGGFLLQDQDTKRVTMDEIEVVSNKKPSNKNLSDMLFAWKVAKYIKSNAIVFAKDMTTVGIGAGQMSRVDSTRIAKFKAEEMAKNLGKSKSFSIGAVAASDAFFPFSDGIIELANAGITSIIQPGGSIRDSEIIDSVNEKNMAMVFTHIRHFNH